MKNVLLVLGLSLILSIPFMSCTENSMVKSWGGTGTLNLQPNEKLVNVTWKNEDLWVLTRPMTPKDSAITYNFSEKSSFGVIEGTYIIIESKK